MHQLLRTPCTSNPVLDTLHIFVTRPTLTVERKQNQAPLSSIHHFHLCEQVCSANLCSPPKPDKSFVENQVICRQFLDEESSDTSGLTRAKNRKPPTAIRKEKCSREHKYLYSVERVLHEDCV